MTCFINHLNKGKKMFFKKTCGLFYLGSTFSCFSAISSLPVSGTVMSSLEHANNDIEEIVKSVGLLNPLCMNPSRTTHAKNVSQCFNEMALLIPAGKFFHRSSTNPESSEVRVSDRAAPLRLTRIRGLAREHFSRADACQHGHRDWVTR